MNKFYKVLLIILSIIIISSQLHAESYWNGDTYTVLIPGGGPSNFLDKARYTMFIPRGLSKIRGVLIHQHGCGAEGWGEPMAQDAQYQAFAKKWGLAILGTDLYPKAGSSCFDWINPEDGSGPALFAGLDSLARQSGHSELNTAPWLLWGHSGGGYWVLAMTKAYPERIIATVSYSPGLLPTFNYPPQAAKIPVLVRHAGATDFNAPGIDCWGTSLAAFSKLRSMGGLASIAYNANQNHNFSFLRLMTIPFFDAVLAQRLPADGSSQLRNMDPNKAWLADTITKGIPNVYKASTFTGNPLSKSWMPDSNCAAKFQQFLVYTYVIDDTPPPAPTKITIDSSAGKGSFKIKWEADADLESGIDHFNIFINGALIARYPESGIFQVFNTNGDTPIPTEQPLMEYTVSGLPIGSVNSISISMVHNFFGMESPKFTWKPENKSDTLKIENFTQELISCANTDGNFIICAASALSGFTAKYQWHKDGIELTGETKPQLNFATFDYPVSGIYTCKVTAQGFDKVLWSGEIPVYALSLPEITDQPKEVINAQIGGTYSFEVKAHYRGKVPPYLKDSFQWYKLESGNSDPTALVDNEKFGGTTSSILTINGLSDTDICQKGEYYFVEINSQCGSVRSNPFIISQKPEVVFSEHPQDTEVCPGSDVVLTANAIAPEGYAVTYSWKKDNSPITDNSKYNGTNTPKLQIFNTMYDDDAGYYQCVAEIPSEEISVEGVPAQLTIKEVPEANPLNGITDYTIKRGNDVAFNVELIRSAEPLTVKWKFDGEVIQEGIWDKFIGDKLLTLSLESINENQAGEYTCSLENECAKTEIKFKLTVIKWDEAGITDVLSENGYSLYSAVPNPTNDIANIKYIMPKSGFVKFTLSDISGRVIRDLFEGYATEGINQLQINVKELNLLVGVYLYTMTSDGFSGVRSFVVE